MYKHPPTCVCDQKTYLSPKLYIFMSQNIFTKVILHYLKKCFIKKMFFQISNYDPTCSRSKPTRKLHQINFHHKTTKMGAYVGRSLKQGRGPLSIRDRRDFFSAYKYWTYFSDLSTSCTLKLSVTQTTF